MGVWFDAAGAAGGALEQPASITAVATDKTLYEQKRFMIASPRECMGVNVISSR
jgi:hypothetical protein